MPFKGGENPQCPRCGHSAFHAESIPAAGKVWHKICFRCGKKKNKTSFREFSFKNKLI
jgi:ribosomal protein L37E